MQFIVYTIENSKLGSPHDVVYYFANFARNGF